MISLTPKKRKRSHTCTISQFISNSSFTLLPPRFFTGFPSGDVVDLIFLKGGSSNAKSSSDFSCFTWFPAIGALVEGFSSLSELFIFVPWNEFVSIFLGTTGIWFKVFNSVPTFSSLGFRSCTLLSSAGAIGNDTSYQKGIETILGIDLYTVSTTFQLKPWKTSNQTFFSPEKSLSGREMPSQTSSNLKYLLCVGNKKINIPTRPTI